MTDLLRVENLEVSFNVDGGQIDAVRDVSFRVPRSGTVALVGESGSGKSVISQAIMGILPGAARIRRGRILFFDPLRPGSETDIAALPPDGADMRSIRGGRISIIFQEPMTSLSPIHSVGDQIGEALHLHRKASAAEKVATARRSRSPTPPNSAPSSSAPSATRPPSLRIRSCRPRSRRRSRSSMPRPRPSACAARRRARPTPCA